jgi:ABC-type glycerol-3-phosphate transport system permease component
MRQRSETFSRFHLLILFFIFQRYFIEGATSSAVKG